MNTNGDCGYPNFLFSENQLSGVIDPQPFIGHTIHDLVFALFCSILTMWKYDDQALSEEVLLRLFSRLSRSAQHHPEDLPEYREAWDRWKTQIK
ncbi:hypothetical protein [Fictibacillus terranigra]|uniref:Uncharacterized protein n=1 Tax=Fictibacillus terranigra TaxID=3058424 RepID=A0ABT8E8B8_9BACL|nr:hypothetical protein [Fictibacillus sp. CENA-BCM004]MDN4074156.1 hypothetical protein [Fictibacillus sp. CENA-BCM004]